MRKKVPPPRLPARHNRVREVDGPFLPTTMGGMQAALSDMAREAATHPHPAAPHAPVIFFCLTNPTFTMDHLRTSRAQSSASLPGPCRSLVTSVVTSLFKQDVNTRGDSLRTAAWSLVFLFSTLVLGPNRPGAPSSVVKAETEARLDLWQRGELAALASRVAAARMDLPQRDRSKKAKATRRASTLLRHNQFARVAGLADNKGIADATQDTIDAIPDMFKEPGTVDEATLRRLYAPKVVPTRESMAVTITTEVVLNCIAEVALLTTPHKDGWRAGHIQALCKDHDCAAAFTDIIGALDGGDVIDDTCDLLSSATLVILLEKTEEEMEALRQK